MKELRQILDEFRSANLNMALATIVQTSGSSYRRAGARMLVIADGRHIGTLSGGCIEGEIAERSAPVIASGEPALFHVDTLRRFGCPGSIDIFVESIEPGNAFLTYLDECFEQRCDAEVVVVFEGAQAASYPRYCGIAPGEGHFEQTLRPPVRLVIIGGGADAGDLVNAGRMLGWETLAFDGPDEACELDADERTALVIKNHHFGRDTAALKWALESPFGYIGLLGSRKRKNQIVDLLADGEIPDLESVLDRLHAPAGLDVGADSPEQIAIAIVAEIQAVMSGRNAGFLREHTGPIHEAASCPVAAL